MDTICRELAGERAAIPVVTPIVPQQPTGLGPLMNRLARMQANLNVLKERGAHPAQVNNVRNDRDTLRETVKQLQDTVARQQTNKNALHQRLREALAQPPPPPVIGPNPLANEVAALRQRLQALEIAGADQPTVDELRRRITDLEGQHAVLGREKNGLTAERNDCRRRLGAIQINIDAVTAQLQASTRNLEAVRAERAELQQRLTNLAMVNDPAPRLRAQIANLMAEIRDKDTIIAQERDAVTARRQEYARLLAAKDVEIAQHNTTIHNMQNQRNAVQAQLNAVQAQMAAQGGARNATVRNLQEQRNALQGQLDVMQAELAEQRDGRVVDVRDLQGRRNTLQRQLNELVAQGAARNAIVRNLQEQRNALRGQLDVMQVELAEQRDGRVVNVRDLQVQRNTLQRQRNTLQRQMNELVVQGEGRNAIVGRLEGNKRDLQGRLNAVQGQLNALQAQMAAQGEGRNANRQALRAELARVQGELAAEGAGRNANRQALQAELARVQGELAAEGAGRNANRQALQAELAAVVRAHNTNKMELEALRGSRNTDTLRLRASMHQLNANRQALQAERQALERRIVDCNTDKRIANKVRSQMPYEEDDDVILRVWEECFAPARPAPQYRPALVPPVMEPGEGLGAGNNVNVIAAPGPAQELNTRPKYQEFAKFLDERQQWKIALRPVSYKRGSTQIRGGRTLATLRQNFPRGLYGNKSKDNIQLSRFQNAP